MKVVILSEVEQFCDEHNFPSVGLEFLRSIAIEKDDDGLAIAYKAGFALCNQAVIEAMAEARPRS